MLASSYFFFVRGGFTIWVGIPRHVDQHSEVMSITIPR